MNKIASFGYKFQHEEDLELLKLEYGLLLDVRSLRNPYKNPKLKYKNGLDKEVSWEILSDPNARKIVNWLAGSGLHSIAIGCFGGQHRSVALVEEIGRITGAKICHLNLKS
jgi:UPF0042 nucleotide-binding protein